MPQIFHPSFNTISRVSIFGAVFFIAGAFVIAGALVRSPYFTQADVIREQPVPFSHQHHVKDCGIDCRYCHTSVEDSYFAGLPSTEVCMNCHNFLFADSPMLEPVRESYRSGGSKPIPWTRVHDLPDFAYFNHSIHLAKGIGCVSCHGQVDEMPLMWRENTLHMEWCLDCHRDPQHHVRPREFVFDMRTLPELAATDEFRDYLAREFPASEFPALHPEGHDAEPDLGLLRARLVERYHIAVPEREVEGDTEWKLGKTYCSVCHR